MAITTSLPFSGETSRNPDTLAVIHSSTYPNICPSFYLSDLDL